MSKFNSPFVIPAIIANEPASILSGITEYVIGFNFETPYISIISVTKPLIFAPAKFRQLPKSTISGS